MATTKTRINVSLSDNNTAAIAQLASQHQVPPATMAARLIETALEMEEDQLWDQLASQRDTKSACFVPHSEAWSA